MSNPNHQLKNCPNCCATLNQPSNINIDIVYAPKGFTEISKNEQDLKYRVWSLMRPPKISAQIPIVKPDRLEKIRMMLKPSSNNDIEYHAYNN